MTSATITRRDFLAWLAAAGALRAVASSSNAPSPMYGLIGKMSAHPGQRDALLAAMLEGTRDMPGCLSYVIATDPQDADALWITEVWTDQASHQGSLKLPQVQAAITKARPLIAGFSNRVETVPVGGSGLPAR